MVVKVYISGISGNKEVKKRQQRVLMILDSKSVSYEVIDITEPGKEADKDFMQTNSTGLGGTIGDPNPRHPLPPQIFNDDEYCGDYDKFDLANEVDTLEQFLKVPVPPSAEDGDKVGDKEKAVNGTTDLEEKRDEANKINTEIETASSDKKNTDEHPPTENKSEDAGDEEAEKDNTEKVDTNDSSGKKGEGAENVEADTENIEKGDTNDSEHEKDGSPAKELVNTDENTVKGGNPSKEEIAAGSPSIEEIAENSTSKEEIAEKTSLKDEEKNHSKEVTPDKESLLSEAQPSSKEGTPAEEESLVKEETTEQNSVEQESKEEEKSNNAREPSILKEESASVVSKNNLNEQEKADDQSTKTETEGQEKARVSEDFIENEKASTDI